LNILQDLAAGNLISIRKLEVNGKIFTNSEKGKKVVNQTAVEDFSLTNISSESPTIPVGAIQSNKGSHLTAFLQGTNYILPISLLSLLLLISILVSVGVCRYLRLHKGTSYYTQEASRDTTDDTAGLHGIQGQGQGVERRREMIA
jgi:hypothetical protein